MQTATQWILLGLFLLGGLPGCTAVVIHRELQQLNEQTPVIEGQLLKLHCRDGTLYMLEKWSQNERGFVNGAGVKFGFNRDSLDRGTYRIPFDSIAIAEVNRLDNVPSPGTGLAVMTTATGIGALICLANPKACFGSCPTFYASDGTTLSLMAEAFSSSIAPCLAATDVDALSNAVPSGRSLALLMKNEALECHVVQDARLLVAPRPPGGRVYKTSDGQFWQTGPMILADSVLTPSGRGDQLLGRLDGKEYFSCADSLDITTRETLDLYFRSENLRRPALMIAHRQTLMTTFLLYQTLAYMGKDAGYWLAKLERSDAEIRSRINGPGEKLGWIEVLVQDESGEWQMVDEVGETGPIATDLSLVPLPEDARCTDGSYHVRVRMTEGYWRIDAAVMVDLIGAVQPTPIYASVAPGPGTDGVARSNTDTVWNKPIITMPGDSYIFNFDLPETSGQFEFFLDARGYYLEWIRDAWLADENPDMVLLMLQDPDEYLERMTPLFKKAESTMEATFWSSKYEKPQ